MYSTNQLPRLISGLLIILLLLSSANFILDKNGRIIYTLYGAIEWDSKEIVDKLSALSES
ncbi:MAG: hypothetical protein OEU50_09065 [Gammaproteobacteria bacterium]|nr:hypothetical protein [Gammaproteobacteria bacterium]